MRTLGAVLRVSAAVVLVYLCVAATLIGLEILSDALRHVAYRY